MPTRWMSVVPKKTRSPGRSWDRATGTDHVSWSAATRGIDTPAWCHTYCVRPEQSNRSGPVPPQRYGFPSSENAHCRAVSTVATGGGIGVVELNCSDVEWVAYWLACWATAIRSAARVASAVLLSAYR